MNNVFTIPGCRKYFDAMFNFLESDDAPKSILPIFVGIYIRANSTENCIMYNTEQLSRIQMLTEVLQTVVAHPTIEIWDYSQANVDILKKYGIFARHVPLNSSTDYVNKLKGYKSKIPEYDVGFCGALSDRRLKILEELKEMNISVNIVEAWGDDRDKELAKCRVQINIHWEDDYQIFESARCEAWLKAGTIVFSEPSLDDDPRCIVVPYDKLSEAIKTFLV